MPEFFTAGERDEFADFLSELPGPYLVCVAGGKDVLACGGWAIRASDRAADLCWGMVRRDRHGSGLGEALTRVRIEGARTDGRARHIALNTSQHTVGFYERLGFRAVRVQADGYAPGLDRYDMILELGAEV